MENKSEIETKRIIVEENIVLKKENRELRDRLTIYERVLDQILRDQGDKRMQILKTEEWFTKRDLGENLRKEYLRLQLHSAIYRPHSFVLMLRYCANLKAIRYESTSLKRIVANKSHRVIVA